MAKNNYDKTAEGGRDYSYLAPYGWKKGKSGNPKGGPKKKRILTTYLKAQLECLCSSVTVFAERAKVLDMDPDETTIGELLAAVTLNRSMNGETGYMQQAFDRVEGKVHSVLEEDEEDVITNKIQQALRQLDLAKENKPDVEEKENKESIKEKSSEEKV